MLHIAIIGGGIAGLSTAYYLQQQIEEQNLPIRYSLLEAGPRLGGKLLTEHVEGYTIEAGPDSFITQKPGALKLVADLGLEEQLVVTQDQNKGVYVYQGGRMKSLPDGVMLIVPTKIMPFALSPLFSPLGKMRMGFDLVLPARTDDGDETLADFIRRRLGSEALDRLAEPLMSGIHNAEAEHQSIMATFPRFRAIEKQHGSLIRGMLAGRRNQARPAPAHNANGSSSARPRSIFMSMQHGIAELSDAVAERLTGDVRVNAPVLAITRTDTGYQLQLPDGERLTVDQVVLATPAFAAADLLADIQPQLAEGLRGIRYVDTGTVSLAYRTQDFPSHLKGFGYVIARSDGRRINAVTWSSHKWPGRAPDGRVLMRVFFGGSRNPDVFHLDDAALLDLVKKELNATMGLEAEPLLSRIYRWPQASPQYDVGHLDRLADLESLCPSDLYLTGSAYRGVGIPDCIAQGEKTAQQVVASLVS